jgi:hypothetical protein
VPICCTAFLALLSDGVYIIDYNVCYFAGSGPILYLSGPEASAELNPRFEALEFISRWGSLFMQDNVLGSAEIMLLLIHFPQKRLILHAIQMLQCKYSTLGLATSNVPPNRGTPSFI